METRDSRQVEVVNISMPFMSMVIFMVKWAIASIPAFIILAVLFMVLATVMAGLMSGFMMAGSYGRF